MSLIDALRLANHNADIVKIYSSTCGLLSKTGFTQVPVLSSSSPTPAFQFARAGVSATVVANGSANGTSSSGKPVSKSLIDNGTLLLALQRPKKEYRMELLT
jgi:hypothetical protein